MLQYIGARYVPIFYQNSLNPDSSEWENNVTYEPLTWVSLPNGTMYISKKTVPSTVGTPAQNGDYWLEAGQFNAYIQNLQQQIDDMNDGSVNGSLQNQINTIDTAITDMNDGTVPGSLQNQINSLGTTVGDHTTDIGNLQTAVADLARYHADRYIILSDSYGTSINGTTPWILTLLSYMNVSSDDYVTIAENGAAFGNNQFPTMISTAITQGMAKDWNADDNVLILVGAGFNDRNIAIGDLRNSMSTFVTTARTAFPRCKIAYAFIAGSSNTGNTLYFNVTLDRFNTVCSEYDVDCFLNVYPALPVTGFIGPDVGDQIHPNQSGQDRIATLITQCMAKGSCENIYSGTMGGPVFGDTSANGVRFEGEFSLRNGQCHLHLEGGTSSMKVYNPATPLQWSFNTAVPFIDIAGGLQLATPVTVPYNILVNSDGTGWKVLPGYLIFTGYHIRFMPSVYGTNVGLTDILNMYLPPIDFDFPASYL